MAQEPDLPLVRVESVADGSTTQFTIPFPFLERDYVYASVDGEPVDFEWLNDSLIIIEPAPPQGAVVLRYRSTYSEHARHIFQSGVPFRPRYIDENNTQLFNVMQEAVSRSEAAMIRADEAVVIAGDALDVAGGALDVAGDAKALVDSVLEVVQDAESTVGVAVLRHDLANPDKGAAMVALEKWGDVASFASGVEMLMNERSILANAPPAPLAPVLGDGTDETSAINAIIAYAHANGIQKVAFRDGIYLVNPGNTVTGTSGGIHLLDNVTLVLSPSAVIRAIPTSSGAYNIIRGYLNTNIGVIGGTIQGERDDHTGVGGEHGHGINLRGCSNVVIDTKVVDCWGDGLYIGPAGTNGGVPCTNIWVPRFEADRNRRQGISITHADGVYGGVWRLLNTGGTAPMAGLDIEPNAYEQTINISVQHIHAEGNAGAGVQIYAEREGAVVDGVSLGSVVSVENSVGLLVRKDKVKGVNIGLLRCIGNTSDGYRVAEGATGVHVDVLESNANGLRGISWSDAHRNTIGTARALLNASSAIEISGGSSGNEVNWLIAEGAPTTTYLVTAYTSSGNRVNRSVLRTAIESVLYLNGANNCEFLNMSISGAAKYPIRLSGSVDNTLDGISFRNMLFEVDDVYSYVRVENASQGNVIKGAVARQASGNKAKYGVQMVAGTQGNLVSFCDFIGGALGASVLDSGVNDIFQNR